MTQLKTKFISYGIIVIFLLNINNTFEFSENEFEFSNEFDLLRNEELFLADLDYEQNKNYYGTINVINAGILESYNSEILNNKKMRKEIQFQVNF
jgi:hypothetical protein